MLMLNNADVAGVLDMPLNLAALEGVKYVSRADSRKVGMIGSGGMARTYLDAIRLVRDIQSVNVFSPNRENARKYALEMRELHKAGLGMEIPTGHLLQDVRD